MSHYHKTAEAVDVLRELGPVTPEQLETLISWAKGDIPRPDHELVSRGHLISALMELRLKRLSEQ